MTDNQTMSKPREFWINKEHNENEILIKRSVYQIEPKYKETWIRTVEYSAYEALKEEIKFNKSDRILELENEKLKKQLAAAKAKVEELK